MGLGNAKPFELKEKRISGDREKGKESRGENNTLRKATSFLLYKQT